jgi:membrane fusion protein, multidrug efflux system
MWRLKFVKKAFLFAILVSAVLASGCGDRKLESTAAATSSPPAALSTSPVQVKPNEFVTVSGPLIVEHQVDVTAQRDGVISSISVETSTRVKAGAVLARLDERQLTANVEAARAKTRSIEADLKNWQAEAEVMQADYVRAQKLWDLKLISEEQLQHAKFKAESEQWDIGRVRELLSTSRQEERSLELELEKASITAPFDGLVARRYVRLGQTVAKGDRLFWVTAEAPLRMRFTLPEKFMGHLKKGETLPLTSPDAPQEKHTARVIEVSAVVDPSSGTIEVLAELLGGRGELRPGMTAIVRLQDQQ